MKKIVFAVGCLLACALMAWPGHALANAFLIQETGAEATGQAGAVVAAGKTPASSFQNAANLSFLKGIHLQGGFTVYTATGSVETKNGEKVNMGSDAIFVPAFFIAAKVTDWLALGVGEFTAFGLKSYYPRDWDGAYNSVSSEIQTFNINPNVSIGPFNGFAFAFGFNAVYGGIRIQRAMTLGLNPLGEEDASNLLTLDGTGWGFGYNFGVMFEPNRWVRLGMSYRSAITMEMSGSADFDVSSLNASRFPDQHFDTSMTLPHLLFFGVRVFPLDTLSFEIDAIGTFWSTFDTLELSFDEGMQLGPERRVMTQKEVKGYQNSLQVRAGMEWWFVEHVAGRLGIMYSGNPIPDDTLDPMVPDYHRINTSIGFGTEWSGFHADIAYMFVYPFPRDVRGVAANPVPAAYEWMAHLVNVSIGYRFDPFVKDDPPESH